MAHGWYCGCSMFAAALSHSRLLLISHHHSYHIIRTHIVGNISHIFQECHTQQNFFFLFSPSSVSSISQRAHDVSKSRKRTKKKDGKIFIRFVFWCALIYSKHILCRCRCCRRSSCVLVPSCVSIMSSLRKVSQILNFFSPPPPPSHSIGEPGWLARVLADFSYTMAAYNVEQQQHQYVAVHTKTSVQI